MRNVLTICNIKIRSWSDLIILLLLIKSVKSRNSLQNIWYNSIRVLFSDPLRIQKYLQLKVFLQVYFLPNVTKYHQGHRSSEAWALRRIWRSAHIYRWRKISWVQLLIECGWVLNFCIIINFWLFWNYLKVFGIL